MPPVPPETESKGEVVKLFDALEGIPANGTFGPSLSYGDTPNDSDLMYVFFTGVYGRVRWWRIAAGRLLSLKRPPFPAPFYFAVGRLTCRRSSIAPG